MVYPEKFALKEVSKALHERGKIFWKCRRCNYVFYNRLTRDGIHGEKSHPNYREYS